MPPEGVSAELDNGEEIVTHYLLKLLGLPLFDKIDRFDLMYLSDLYAGKLMYELHKLGPDSSEEWKKEVHVREWLRMQQKAERQRVSVPECQRTPVVCFRCKLPGHIARGCKQFRCFRCFELGHTVNGCRKHRSSITTSSSGMSPSTSREEEARTPSSGTSSEFSRMLSAEVSTLAQCPKDCKHENAMSCPLVVLTEKIRPADMATTDDETMAGNTESGDDDVDAGLDSDQDDDCASDGGSDGLLLRLEGAVSEQDDDCEQVNDDADEQVDHDSDSVNEDNYVLTKFNEEDDDRPCWTYLSEEAGVDCTDMALHDFLEYLESDANTLDDQDQSDILCAIKEEQADMEMGISNKYWFMYQ